MVVKRAGVDQTAVKKTHPRDMHDHAPEIQHTHTHRAGDAAVADQFNQDWINVWYVDGVRR